LSKGERGFSAESQSLQTSIALFLSCCPHGIFSVTALYHGSAYDRNEKSSLSHLVSLGLIRPAAEACPYIDAALKSY
jgi:hypothetical protein